MQGKDLDALQAFTLTLFGTIGPMIRIDCHAHAFPSPRNGFEDRFMLDDWVPGPWKEPVQSIGSQVSSLLSPLKGLVGDTVKTVTPVADQLGQEAWKRLPTGW